MFRTLISVAIISTALAGGVAAPAHAGEGEGGDYAETRYRGEHIRSKKVRSGGRMVTKRKGRKISIRHKRKQRAFIRMRNPDGSVTEVRSRRDGSRRISRRTRNGVRVRNVNRRTRSWAHNHSTGVTSVGVRPGLRVVISPFGISISN
ncbi:MAG: hypothetical protein AAF468_09400 [Pseudomonadota bacterium]